MDGTDWIDTGRPMARMERVRVVAPFTLEIAWAEGERAGRTDIVDLSPALGSYKIYRTLRDDAALFASVSPIEDGYALGFAGSDAEMSADMIEQLADETMSPAEFAAFLKRNKLTQDAAAALLGRSRRQIGYYLKPGPVPRIVALACFGYEALQVKKKGRAG